MRSFEKARLHDHGKNISTPVVLKNFLFSGLARSRVKDAKFITSNDLNESIKLDRTISVMNIKQLIASKKGLCEKTSININYKFNLFN
jgi:hypothetical protein